MSAADLFAPQWVSLWVTGALLLALSAWLFLLDVANRAQRLFALLLALRGLTYFLGPLRSEASSVQWSVLWLNLAAYVTLPLVPIVVYFLCVYPRKRGLALRPWGPWVLVAATVGLLAWYIADHAAYAQVRAANPASYASFGPLFLLNVLPRPVFALAGFLLAGDYRRSPSGSAGFSLFLMVAAFTLNGLYDGTLSVIEFALADEERFAGSWEWATWWVPLLTLPIALATCVRLLPVLRLAREDRELQEVTRFFVAAVPLALLTPFIALLPAARDGAAATFILGTWRLVIPFVVTYALMRYRLFDLDMRLQAGVQRLVIVGAFTVTFFLVSEAAESMLSAKRAPIVGIVAAGLLAMAIKPIERLADRMAKGVMPDTQPVHRMGSQARFRLYLEQYSLVQQDGSVNQKERRLLDRLAGLLELRPGESSALEAGNVPARDDPAPAQPPRKVSVAARNTVLALSTALIFGAVSAILEAMTGASSFLQGLAAAAVVMLLLHPLESLAQRLTRRPTEPAALREMQAALTEAWADGELSPRDKAYLASLQKRLRIPSRERRRLEAGVRSG